MRYGVIETTVLWSVLVACPKHGSLSSLTVVAYPTNGSLSIGGIPYKWEPVLIDGNPTGGGRGASVPSDHAVTVYPTK